MTFSSTADMPSAIERVVSFQVSDGGTQHADSLVALVKVALLQGNDAVLLSEAVISKTVVELTDASAQDLRQITGRLVVSDRDLGDSLDLAVAPPVIKLNGQIFMLPNRAEALISPSAFVTLLLETESNGGNIDLAYGYNPGPANLDFLASGDLLTITYAVTVTDGKTSATRDITFTIQGSNDAARLQMVPAITIDDTSADDHFDALTGTLLASDADQGETLSYGILAVMAVNGVSTLAGDYGTLTVNAVTGAYQYQPNDAAVGALDAGQSRSESFQLTVTEQNGNTTVTPLVVTVNGAEEGPRIVTGGPDADTLMGSDLGELLIGGDGPDELYGGLGADRYDLRESVQSADIVHEAGSALQLETERVSGFDIVEGFDVEHDRLATGSGAESHHALIGNYMLETGDFVLDELSGHDLLIFKPSLPGAPLQQGDLGLVLLQVTELKPENYLI